MIKRAKFQVLLRMQEVSLYTNLQNLAFDPAANPPSLKDSYDIKRSSPLAVLYIKSAGKIGTDEPPRTNAFKGRSELIPLDIHLSS
jgi:hypothetical protein